MDSAKAKELNAKIVEVGEKIRKLKADKASKEDIDGQVAILLELKKEFKSATGADWKPEVSQPATKPAAAAVSFEK